MHTPDPVLLGLSDAELLLVLLYGECRGSSTEAQTAVACSVRNRVNSGKWYGGQDYRAVILRWAQYDAIWPALGGPNYQTTLAFAKRLPRLTSTGELALQAAANGVVGGTIIDPTSGATHYFDESIKPPAWAVPPAEESYVAGRLHFWRGVA